MGRHNESPEPLAGYRPCVGILLLSRTNGIFVGQRHDSGGDAWQMPQGGIDKGEDPVTAGFREMREEIGTDLATLMAVSAVWRSYDLPPEIAKRMWRGRYLGQTQKWLAFRFDGTDADINIATPEPEFRAWQWVDADNLIRDIVPFKRDVYRSVIAECRPLLDRR